MMGRPVHVGEFGVYRAFLPPGDSALEYLRDMRLALAEMGLAWSLWEWKAGFGYWDSSLARPHPGAVSGLWGRPEIRQQPVAVTLNEGAGVALRVEAFGHPGDGPLGYEWFRDDVLIHSGASAPVGRRDRMGAERKWDGFVLTGRGGLELRVVGGNEPERAADAGCGVPRDRSCANLPNQTRCGKPGSMVPGACEALTSDRAVGTTDDADATDWVRNTME